MTFISNPPQRYKKKSTRASPSAKNNKISSLPPPVQTHIRTSLPISRQSIGELSFCIQYTNTA